MSKSAGVTVRVPLAIRRRGGRKLVVTPNGDGPGAAPARTRADPALVKALARAHRWKRLLESGRYGSLAELAAAERIDRSYLGKMLRLTLLAPDIVGSVLDGQWSPDFLGSEPNHAFAQPRRPESRAVAMRYGGGGGGSVLAFRRAMGGGRPVHAHQPARR